MIYNLFLFFVWASGSWIALRLGFKVRKNGTLEGVSFRSEIDPKKEHEAAMYFGRVIQLIGLAFLLTPLYLVFPKYLYPLLAVPLPMLFAAYIYGRHRFGTKR